MLLTAFDLSRITWTIIDFHEKVIDYCPKKVERFDQPPKKWKGLNKILKRWKGLTNFLKSEMA